MNFFPFNFKNAFFGILIEDLVFFFRWWWYGGNLICTYFYKLTARQQPACDTVLVKRCGFWCVACLFVCMLFFVWFVCFSFCEDFSENSNTLKISVLNTVSYYKEVYPYSFAAKSHFSFVPWPAASDVSCHYLFATELDFYKYHDHFYPSVLGWIWQFWHFRNSLLSGGGSGFCQHFSSQWGTLPFKWCFQAGRAGLCSSFLYGHRKDFLPLQGQPDRMMNTRAWKHPLYFPVSF